MRESIKKTVGVVSVLMVWMVWTYLCMQTGFVMGQMDVLARLP